LYEIPVLHSKSDNHKIRWSGFLRGPHRSRDEASRKGRTLAIYPRGLVSRWIALRRCRNSQQEWHISHALPRLFERSRTSLFCETQRPVKLFVKIHLCTLFSWRVTGWLRTMECILRQWIFPIRFCNPKVLNLLPMKSGLSWAYWIFAHIRVTYKIYFSVVITSKLRYTE
jgi:hypothetical protein